MFLRGVWALQPLRHPERRAKPVVELLRVEGAKHRTSKSAKCEALSRIYERLPIALHRKCYFPFVRTTKFVTRSLRRCRSSAFARLASLPPNRFDYGCTHPSLRMTGCFFTRLFRRARIQTGAAPFLVQPPCVFLKMRRTECQKRESFSAPRLSSGCPACQAQHTQK